MDRERIEEKPLVIPTSKGYLYSMLHRPKGEQLNKCAYGIIICPPIAHEWSYAYRVLVNVARRIALAGMFALRFDYYGVGESSGNFEDCALNTYIYSIQSAITKLQGLQYPVQIGLLGVRLGGMFAMLASNRVQNVNCMILIDPVTDPKMYIRELYYSRAISITQPSLQGVRDQLKQNPDEEERLDVGGFTFGRRFLRDLMCHEDVQVNTSFNGYMYYILTKRGQLGGRRYGYATYPEKKAEIIRISDSTCDFWSRNSIYKSPTLEKVVLQYLERWRERHRG